MWLCSLEFQGPGVDLHEQPHINIDDELRRIPLYLTQRPLMAIAGGSIIHIS